MMTRYAPALRNDRLFVWWVVIPLIVILAGILPAYNHWHDSVFREGYERGALQTADYVTQFNAEKAPIYFPSGAWRDCAWRFANTPGRPDYRDQYNRPEYSYVTVCDQEAAMKESHR